MFQKKVIWAGLAAGILGHILQGVAAFLFFDRFYLENAELLRDVGWMVGLYYLIPNLVVGIVISYLANYFKMFMTGADWQIGIRAGIVVWLGSSPVVIIKRQIIFALSNWLLLETLTDLIIFALIGAVAGFLNGRGIIERKKRVDKVT